MNSIKVGGLLCNRLENPVGFQLGNQPRLSWIVDSDNAEEEITSLIEVAEDEEFSSIIFSSGKSGDIDSICYTLPIALKPRTRYFWRVTVFSKQGERASERAFFETSKMEEPWNGKWISPDFDPSWHPVVFTEFDLPSEPVSARAYICGLGVYEFSINDRRWGNEYLSPGLCAYDKWLPYQTYDITEGLKEGKNSIDIMLGNGWYKGRYGLIRRKNFRYGHEFACICELHIICRDGSTKIIASDNSWSARRSSVISSSIFDGEVRDDTLDTAGRYSVKAADLDTGILEPRRSPPTEIMHRIKPVEIIHTPAGETVIDMGQNMTGWVEFACRMPKGAEVHLQFGEVMQEGNFYRDNLRTALAEYRYTSDGSEKKVRPFFTFYGFRYIKLTQWHQEVSLSDFTGLVLYSHMRPTGRITTGNEKVNKLIENTLWGQRGNFLDVPTDCPQRDERMGWTGDAQVFFGTAAFNMDVSAFFSKYCYDLMKEQQALGGTVPVVIPKHDVEQTGSCAWGDAATIIPWNMYIRYGDISILEQQYPSMKGWVDYIHKQDEKNGGGRLWEGDFHYCDWLSLDGEDPIGNRFGGTERTYLASCYYRYSAMLVAKAAHVLGKEKDALEYEKLSNEVREAVIREYVTETGRLAVNTQTGYILALFFDIIPDKWREKTAYMLRLKLKESNYHLRTGFVGTPYLCRVLSETGSNDIAYRLLLQEDFPSWLYEVNMGATTIWERWNSILPDGSISDTGMNSLNHYSYGSIVEWLYRNCGGIQPLEDYPGFRKFRIAPQPDISLKTFAAEFDSPVGLIKSLWRYETDGEISLEFTVPFGATAELLLPDYDGKVRELKSGTHKFKYKPAKAGEEMYNFDTPISRLLAEPAVAEVLSEELPEFTSMMLFNMMAGERSINDFVREKFLSFTEEQEMELCKKMNQVGRGV